MIQSDSSDACLYTLHPATTADYRYCYNLCKQSMLDLFTRHWGGWKSESFRSEFILSDTMIIRVKARRAGWYAVRDRSDHLFISDLYVSPTYRGKGIGTAIIKKILESSPYPAVRLTTFEDNPAIGLYRRMGFRVDKHKGRGVEMYYVIEANKT